MKAYKILWDNVFKYCKPLLLLIILSSSVYAFSLISMVAQKTYFDRVTMFLHGNYSFGLVLFWLAIFYITRSFSGGFLIPLSGAKDLYYDYSVTYQVQRSQHRINNAARLENYDTKEIFDLMQRSNDALTSGALKSTVNSVAAFLTMAISFISMAATLYLVNESFLFLAAILVFPIFLEHLWFEKRQYILEKDVISEKRKQKFDITHICDREFYISTKVAGAANYFIGEWESLQEHITELQQAIHRRRLLFGLITGVIKSMCVVTIVFIAFKELSLNRISLGTFALLIGVIGMLLSYMDFFVHTLSQSVVRIQELREVSKYYNIPLESNSIMPNNHIDSIELENVSFKYQSVDEMAVKNINLSFKKGEKVAIFGVNGAGKTTLTNLIMGLYTPTMGVVKYDGVDISQYNKGLWREKITAVFQDYGVYNLTIHENVYLGNLKRKFNATSLDEALTIAGFPNGKYEGQQKIGRAFGGIELSKGERQKLAIARSYYNDEAELIIIDEPTAALDPIAEEALYQSFLKDAGEKTMFLVSHRLSAARIVDRILVIDSAQIIEDGTHEQLIAQNGIYAKAYKAQATLYRR